MVRSCAAVGCINRWKSDSPVYFYRIPKDLNLKKKWLNNIKREVQLPKDEKFFICSTHFEEKYFKRDLEVSLVCFLLKKSFF